VLPNFVAMFSHTRLWLLYFSGACVFFRVMLLARGPASYYLYCQVCFCLPLATKLNLHALLPMGLVVVSYCFWTCSAGSCFDIRGQSVSKRASV